MYAPVALCSRLRPEARVVSALSTQEKWARKIQVPCEEEFRWTSVTQGGHKAATDHVQPGILAVEVGRRFGIQEVELQRLSRVWVWGRGSKEVRKGKSQSRGSG